MSKKVKSTKDAVRDWEKRFEGLRKLCESVSSFGAELPSFSFERKGNSPCVGLYSAILESRHLEPISEEVDRIGWDGNGVHYYPEEMEFWVKSFRAAADRVEDHLAHLRSNPGLIPLGKNGEPLKK